MAIEYPVGVPLPLRADYAFESTNNISRTEMQSGRARQRVEFEDVPDMLNLKWNLTSPQSSLFSVWARKVVGAGWFKMKVLTPLGFENLELRFTERVQGPALSGRSAWDWSAKVEVRETPELDPEWLYLPEYVLYADIFDIAVNSKLPLDKYQVYIKAVDLSINLEWPEQ